MSKTFRNLKAVVAASLISLSADAALAQRLDEDSLLQDLRTADPVEAMRIERELQAIWALSGSPAMDLLLKRARDAEARGEIELSLQHLTALTDHAPEFAEGWSERAKIRFRMGRMGPAVADLERALMLNPHDYNAIYGLGQILELFGDEEQAYEAYTRAKAIHPHHEAVSNALERLAERVNGAAL